MYIKKLTKWVIVKVFGPTSIDRDEWSILKVHRIIIKSLVLIFVVNAPIHDVECNILLNNYR